MTQDYTGARVLGTFERFGETFLLVRKRPHWRRYLVVLHDGDEVGNCHAETDPVKALAEFERKFDLAFKKEADFRRVREELRSKADA